MTSTKTPPGYYSEAEVAEMLGVAIRTLRKNAEQKKGPPRVAIHRRIFYRAEAFREWLKAQERDFGAQHNKRRSKGTKHVTAGMET